MRKPFSHVVGGRISSDRMVGSLAKARDDCRFDHTALLRWADDGGRGLDNSIVALG